MTRQPKPCGTYAAYLRHKRRGEEPCTECRDAFRAYHRAHKAKRSSESRNRATARQYARNRALDRLAREYPSHYRALYLEELER